MANQDNETKIAEGMEDRIAALERELGVSDPATRDEVASQRRAAAAEHRAVRRQLLARVTGDEKEVLGLVKDYQKAAEKMVGLIVKIRRLRETQRLRCGELANWVPLGLAPAEVDRRLGGFLAELLWERIQRPKLGGSINLAGVGGIFSGIDDWAGAETKIMGQQIAALEAAQEGIEADGNERN